MPGPLFSFPARHTLLLVDDEPDMRLVTQLSLRGLAHGGREVDFLTAGSGAEAVRILGERPDVAVVLLDVVMETPSAGLDAVRAVRERLGNRFVRILLCTGQPGMAPERRVMEEYDIDGYLTKGEYSVDRLYSTVRAALKSWQEIMELERHRRCLQIVEACGESLHSFDPLPETLHRVLDAARAVCRTPLAVLHLETFAAEGDPQVFSLHLAEEPDPVLAEAAASEARRRVASTPGARANRTPVAAAGGVLVPLVVHRDLGAGWIFLEGAALDDLARQALSMLAAHAANAVYATVAQAMLAARHGAVFDDMAV